MIMAIGGRSPGSPLLKSCPRRFLRWTGPSPRPCRRRHGLRRASVGECLPALAEGPLGAVVIATLLDVYRSSTSPGEGLDGARLRLIVLARAAMVQEMADLNGNRLGFHTRCALLCRGQHRRLSICWGQRLSRLVVVARHRPTDSDRTNGASASRSTKSVFFGGAARSSGPQHADNQDDWTRRPLIHARCPCLVRDDPRELSQQQCVLVTWGNRERTMDLTTKAKVLAWAAR